MTADAAIDPAINGMGTDTTAAPKKRRRRAAATGASEDCFTCRKRQTKCDRRRPYCGQCLEIGKDCSGYKTTLTWGVGVASRGKLRGLSCPVANPTTQETPETKKTAPAHKRKASTTKISKASKPAKEAIFKSAYADDPPLTFFTSTPFSTRNRNSDVKTELDSDPFHFMHLPAPIPIQQQDWHYTSPYPAPAFHGSIHGSISHSHGSSLDSESGLSHLRTSLHQPFDDTGFPVSASSMTTFSDLEYATPAEYPQSPLAMQYPTPFSQARSNPYSASDGGSSGSGSVSMGPFFESSEDMHNLGFPQPPFSQEEETTSQYTHDYEPIGHLDMDAGDLESQQLLDGSIDLGLTIPPSLYYSQFFHLPSRMQYLLDYYDKHICSVLVAFDSPANPYRQHVLELATQNEGLQNAIAALAINNMRMRSQERTGSIGFIEELSEQDSRANADAAAQSKPSPEECCYKTVSINHLQMQLADPRNAQDDSILATLLILCLFHVCDSGFSKFKTQLEGVQKLLSMRDPSVRTGFIGWVEMFFTWFDVMTSTVNDRETAIRGDRLDMMQYSSNLGALEEFSGCDGRLFKLIARLGRLNLLSQNKPVRSERDGEATPRSSATSRRPRPFGPGRWQKRKPIDPMDFTKLDGNGWGTPIVSSDEEDVNDQSSLTDARHEFWSEWNDIRARLQSWSMNASTEAAANESETMGPEQRDMIHINESFRSSALLYTERLAHPHLPSSSPNFQKYVREALTHITSISVTSCVNKFLLWPLFIAGTECVEISDRTNVRERCVEIQKESGFYNNLSVLEVLERVWAEQGEESDGGEEEEVIRRRKDSTGAQGGFGQAFRWRKAMNRVDGEYIIV